jgi:hemolysin III
MDKTHIASSGDIDPLLTPELVAERQALAERLRDEEVLNSLTHAVGFVLSIVGAAWLMREVVRHGDRWQAAACAIYGGALIAVYAMSTLSHLFLDRPLLRRLFRMLDQAFIFLLIAGTFTPIAATYLRTGWWPALLAAMWVLALAGFFSKTVLGHQVDAATSAAQVALGWLPVLSAQPMLEHSPRALLLWMLAGGLCYTAGTFFLSRDLRYARFHAIWHLFVIAGSTCHFVAILWYCTTAPR